MRKFTKHQAVLCAIARDEDRYIVEWVAYHLSIGFEHVYIYDNMSIRPVCDLLSPSIKKHSVTVIRWPSIPGVVSQLTAYEHFIHTYRHSSEWVAIIDLDELINLKQDRTIQDFLARFPTADCVAVNWRIFGSSGEARARKAPLMERFVKASPLDFDPNKLVKSIYRLERLTSARAHDGAFSGAAEIRSPDGRLLPSGPHAPQCAAGYAVAQINHYFTKSREEWVSKNARGYADDTRRTEGHFTAYDRNEEIDTSILRRKPAFYRKMKQVSARRRFIPLPYSVPEQVMMACMNTGRILAERYLRRW